MRKTLDFVHEIIVQTVLLTLALGVYRWITMPLTNSDWILALIVSILIKLIMDFGRKREKEVNEHD